MDANELKQQIDKLSEHITNFDTTPLAEIWETKRAIFDLFKVTDFESKEERAEIRNDLQPLLDTLDFKHQKRTEENEKFAVVADEKIDAYSSLVDEALAGEKLEKEEYGTLRSATEELLEFIKQSKWPSKERRTAAWDRFQAKREEWKQKEDAWYDQKRAAMAERKLQSQSLVASLAPAIEGAAPAVDVAGTIEQTKNFLTKNDLIAAGTEGAAWLQGLPEDATKQSLKIKSTALVLLRKFMVSNREAFEKEDRDNLFEKLHEIEKQMDQSWAEYKEQRKLAQADREVKRQEYETKQKEWRRKQEDFLKMLQTRLKNKIEYRDKLQAQPNNNEGQITKIEDRISNQLDFIARLQENIEDLEDQINNAWSKGFKERATGWIEEKKLKMEQVQKDVEDLTKKIEQLKNNKDELPQKIKTIDGEIAEMEAKIDEVKAKLQKLPSQEEQANQIDT